MCWKYFNDAFHTIDTIEGNIIQYTIDSWVRNRAKHLGKVIDDLIGCLELPEESAEELRSMARNIEESIGLGKGKSALREIRSLRSWLISEIGMTLAESEQR